MAKRILVTGFIVVACIGIAASLYRLSVVKPNIRFVTRIGRPAPLFTALDRDDLAEVNRLLRAGVDPNSRVDTTTALDHAIWSDSGGIVERLLEAGVDPNQPGLNGETPLISSIIRGKFRAFEVLLDGGADPNGKLFQGATPLTILEGPGGGLIPQVRRLVRYGADPNLVGEDKRVPLETAAYIGKPELIDVLIELGARVGPEEGWSALYWAACSNKLDNIDCLLKHGVDPNGVGGADKFTVYQRFVADQYRFKTAMHLIEAGADPERPFPDGETPIKIARSMNNWELVEFLTDYAEKKSKLEKLEPGHP